MVLTLDLSDDLAAQLRHYQEDIPRILALGLREVHASDQPGFKGLAGVLETLAALPTPEEVLSLRPSASLQDRIHELLEKNRSEGLSAREEREWERYQFLEHLVRIAKAKAVTKLKRKAA